MSQHLALPIAVTGTGRLATVVQDSEADIAQSVALLVDTRPGERRATPDYGVPDPLFGGVDSPAIVEAVLQFEDRADLPYLEQIAAGVIDALQVHADTTSTPTILDTDVEV